VVLAVKSFKNIGSFFFFFVYCCDDVWVVVVAAVPCGMCDVLPAACHMQELQIVCDRNRS